MEEGDRVDLAMDIRHVHHQRDGPFNLGHLHYLMCGNQTVFANSSGCKLFFSAIRLQWKISGRALRTLRDHENDLVEFLRLEFEHAPIISDLFTDVAMFYLLEQPDSDGLAIMATIMKDIYDTQWKHWTDMNTNSGHRGARLVIAHAQATSNQLSNFVLAFKQGNSQLRKWAEETASRHLMAIITPGHLPAPASSGRNRKMSVHQTALGRPGTTNHKRKVHETSFSSQTPFAAKKIKTETDAEKLSNAMSNQVVPARQVTRLPVRRAGAPHTNTHGELLKDQISKVDTKIAEMSAGSSMFEKHSRYGKPAGGARKHNAQVSDQSSRLSSQGAEDRVARLSRSRDVVYPNISARAFTSSRSAEDDVTRLLRSRRSTQPTTSSNEKLVSSRAQSLKDELAAVNAQLAEMNNTDGGIAYPSTPVDGPSYHDYMLSQLNDQQKRRSSGSEEGEVIEY